WAGSRIGWRWSPILRCASAGRANSTPALRVATSYQSLSARVPPEPTLSPAAAPRRLQCAGAVEAPLSAAQHRAAREQRKAWAVRKLHAGDHQRVVAHVCTRGGQPLGQQSERIGSLECRTQHAAGLVRIAIHLERGPLRGEPQGGSLQPCVQRLALALD